MSSKRTGSKDEEEVGSSASLVEETVADSEAEEILSVMEVPLSVENAVEDTGSPSEALGAVEGVVAPEGTGEAAVGLPGGIEDTVSDLEAESTDVDPVLAEAKLIVEDLMVSYLTDIEGVLPAESLIQACDARGFDASVDDALQDEMRDFFANAGGREEFLPFVEEYVYKLLSSVTADDGALLDDEVSSDPRVDIPNALRGKSGYLQWQVTLPYDDNGSVKSGSDLLQNPPVLDFFIEDEEGTVSPEPVMRLSLNKKTAYDLQAAVNGAVGVYVDKEKKALTDSAKEVWESFIEKNRASKFVRYLNLSVLVVVVGVVVYGALLIG